MEKERLKFTIQRFDHYYASVNTKVNVFLALGTFLLSGIFAYHQVFIDSITVGIWPHIVIVAIVLIGVINIGLILWAVIPYINNKKSRSVYFFSSVAQMNQNEFVNKSKNLSTDAELRDLRDQVHQLSRGLQRKFRLLRISGYFFLVKFVLLSIIFFLTIN